MADTSKSKRSRPSTRAVEDIPQAAPQAGPNVEGVEGDEGEEADEDEESPPTSRKRARTDDASQLTPPGVSEPSRTKRSGGERRAKASAEKLSIPTTPDELTAADRMLLDARKEGKGWKEIGAEWERMTGRRVSAGALPSRYTRLREHFGDFDARADELLLSCKRDLEATWAREVWQMVAQQMARRGGGGSSSGSGRYAPAALERRFAQLSSRPVKVEDTEDGDEQ